MSGALKWDGPKAQALIAAKVRRLLTACAIVVTNRARQLLSVPGTGPAGGKRRTYGAGRSAPGEPPRKQHGRLRASVAFEVVGLVARVGTNVKYGRWLELGTRAIAPRPWLRRALLESQAAIRSILAGAPKL